MPILWQQEKFTPKYIGIHEKQDQWHAIFSNQLFQTRALLEPALRNVGFLESKTGTE